MKEISAVKKTVSQVLERVKYNLDYYQREYMWSNKEINQFLEDLTGNFLGNYDGKHNRQEVRNYEHYFLGPIILSQGNGQDYSIIDGQQRLTTLTLLIIYLNNIQKSREKDHVSLENLIFSEKYGVKSLNINVPEREECMKALYESGEFVTSDNIESVQNIINGYSYIQDQFPEELKDKALLYFIDWLIYNVEVVEIVTYSDSKAYTIFETMNDRGMRLRETEMLKAYVLSKISEEYRSRLNDSWKQVAKKIKEISDLEDEDDQFFRAWFRGKYAITIRPKKEGSENEDFEKIGTRFHVWFREKESTLFELKDQEDFQNFISTDMEFFSKQYISIVNSQDNYKETLESLYNINWLGLGYSIFYPMLLSPVNKKDSSEIILKKFNLVSKYLESFVVFRKLNYRTISQSSIRYAMYSLVKSIRDKDLKELSELLKAEIKKEYNFKEFAGFSLTKQNKSFIKFMLAKITSHIERQSGLQSPFSEYLSAKYQIEHIWADKYSDHKDEFQDEKDFEEERNKIGALLLLPESFNKSYNSSRYEEKLPHYFGQNLLARSLNHLCYKNNPRFLKYIERSGFPFNSMEHFRKEEKDRRQNLYRLVLEEIYDPNQFDQLL